MQAEYKKNRNTPSQDKLYTATLYVGGKIRIHVEGSVVLCGLTTSEGNSCAEHGPSGKCGVVLWFCVEGRGKV